MTKAIPLSSHPDVIIRPSRESPLFRWLFADIRFSPVWLLLRLFVGYEWLMAGINKLSHSGWIGGQAGLAVQGFLQEALTKASGDHPAVTPAYAWFIQNIALPNAPLFSYLVTFGELAVGLALILGLLTGWAAFFGLIMNLNYILAGSAGLNPVLLAGEILLLLAWRNAGWWGIDRWLLPKLGWVRPPGRPGSYP